MTYAPKTQVITAEYVQAPRCGVVLRVPIENVTHFTFSDKYASAHTTSGELLLDISLHEIEKIMGDQVVRLHRSCLAMKSAMLGLRRECGAHVGFATVSAENPVELNVSRSQYRKVRSIMRNLEIRP